MSDQELAESLRRNEIDPKLLYVTPRQSELWREVFLRHSPIHRNPEFARIYREAFARIAETLPQHEVHLVGLGCGTGMKEADLCSKLMKSGRRVLFSAIDISRELVDEASQKLVAAGAVSAGGLVCDLTKVDLVSQWLSKTGHDAPRLFTFFGIVPNFKPKQVTNLFREILRPADTLLVSAHLAPVAEDVDMNAAMRKILPQYNNPETLAWLQAGLGEWGLTGRVGAPDITIGEFEGIPAFLGFATWKSEPRPPLQLFRSLRYTPELFEKLLHKFAVERLAMTSCREEAIWSVRQGSSRHPLGDSSR